MNMLKFHIGNYALVQKPVAVINKIAAGDDDGFTINLADTDGYTHDYYVYPERNFEDGKPESLDYLGNHYEKNDLYIFCANWITEDILNTLEAGND